MASLKRVLCQRLPLPNRPTPLAEAEAGHMMRVLRLKDGDLLEAMDGNGHAAIVKLRTRNGEPRLEFTEKPAVASPDQKVPVVLEMAILKGDAMEWIVEKAVELGVSTLIPLITAHTVVQVDRKGPEAFRERWQKIADQALKQCGRLERMEVKIPMDLDQLLVTHTSLARLWCDESERGTSLPLLNWLENSREEIRTEIRVLIGPEGGWSELERQILSRSKVIPVSLGPLVLRGETAAIYAISLLAADHREKKH